MQVLHDRRTSRDFSSQRLTAQDLSNLLWAAGGINRPESGKRTAPSSRNCQATDIYMTTEDGVYLYEAKSHKLIPRSASDLRAMTGRQTGIDEAPVSLVYVSDLGRMKKAGKEKKILYSGANTGFISQNVYLYCASQGFATVVRGNIDRSRLARALGLRRDQKVVLSQSIGYPKDLP